MSVRFQTNIVCDGAACRTTSPVGAITDASPSADDWGALRAAAARGGWTRKLVNGRIGDFCPDCSAFLADVPDYRAAG